MIRAFFAAFGVLLLLLGAAAEAQQSGTRTGAQNRRQASPAQKHDANQPIEITADNLEVHQDRHQALFTGNVQAIQGGMRLVADRLTVTYRESKARGAAPPPPNAVPGAPGSMGSIERIDAQGNVHMSSPEEAAQGDSGVYDVDRRVVTLVGRVVLTRDQNVLRGDRLVWNLETGTSRLEGGPTTGTGGGRVKGVFVPEQKPAGSGR
ncbi:MAG: hypothetical protein FJX47_21505 [Alphaproteobacteria bacterium]|nr:hypothetical protein [Alphaproteobacteria bacterium]